MTSISASNPEARLSQKRLRVRIDKAYVSEPVISELIRKFDLTINIQGALLAPSAQEDGWFDLVLKGSVGNITQGISYLNDLNLEIVPDKDTDGW